MKFIPIYLVYLTVLFAEPAHSDVYPYDVSSQNPFGVLNPEAPAATADFAQMIGESTCQSVKRIDQSTWAEPIAMLWRFKYIMNGMAVQDETLKSDGIHSGSIRQYDRESQQWQVHYYSTGATSGGLPYWTGGKIDKSLVFNREQAAPNGMAGQFRLTFSEISAKGFQWVGAWISEDESIVYPTWKISCLKQVKP